MKRWMPLWVAPLILVLSVATVWLRLTIIRTTYSINQTDREIREERQNRDQLALKVTALRSPRRLEALAKQTFNLGPAKSAQVIRMQAPVVASRPSSEKPILTQQSAPLKGKSQ
jgi:cell division protein FtsL